MQHEIFRGTELRRVMRWVYLALGDDALILDTRVVQRGGTRIYEIRAATPTAVEEHHEALRTGGTAAPWDRSARERSRLGPAVVALVGPPGTGKTTTLMKLALNPVALGRYEVGLVTLDTFRVGAVEELQTYAEIAGLPLEVAYTHDDVPGVLQRLRDKDVILVDTPGRDPRAESGPWWDLLAAFRPQEVHLALPAGLRGDVVRGLQEVYGPCGPTHLLPTKADELPPGADLQRFTRAVDLPVRWVAMGHEIPGHLETGSRLLAPARGPRRVHDTDAPTPVRRQGSPPAPSAHPGPRTGQGAGRERGTVRGVA